MRDIQWAPKYDWDESYENKETMLLPDNKPDKKKKKSKKQSKNRLKGGRK